MSIGQITAYLETWAQLIRLDVFTFFGSILEEIIAPIPSPFIMTTAGALALAQNKSFLYLTWIVITGALGKTIASIIVYWIVDKSEDYILIKFGKYIGISHAQVEKLGKYFSGNAWDDILLFGLRAVPFVPTFYISAVAGFIKLNLTTFTLMTFLGSIVRNVFYIIVGVIGLEQFMLLIKAHPTNANLIIVSSVVLFGILFFVATKYKNKLESIIEKKIEDKIN